MSLKSKKPKLTVELVPSTCHFSNVRTTVKPIEWDKIRHISYEAAGHKCEICGETGKQQGYPHDVECHEIWEYDDVNHIQKLVGLISLCPTCHQVKHLGRAIAIGKQSVCFHQLAKINKWDIDDINDHVLASFELHRERSKYEWMLDITLLKEEPYCIKIKETGTRKFVVKKYKKKRKKKKTTTKATTPKITTTKPKKRPPK